MESGDSGRRARPKKLEMFLFGILGLGALLRLIGGEAGVWRWFNVVVLLAAVIGTAVAALRPSVFERRPH